MCGRYTLTSPAEQLELFDVLEAPELPPRYNIAPTQEVPVIRRRRDEEAREVVIARWGLVPYFAKDPSIGNRMINARGETVAEKPAFRDAFQRRRCLVPADGFFEWIAEGRVKQPYRIAMRSGEPFGMAGLYERWRDPEGRWLRSFTIITTEANEAVSWLHDRMPVILPRADWEPWLDPAVRSPELLLPLIRPFEDQDAMETYRVSRLVNKPANDVPECVERELDLFS